MQVNKGLLAAGAGLIVVLLVAVAYLLGTRSQSTPTPQNHRQDQPESAAAPAIESASQEASAETALIGRPINACYHLDSCNYWKAIEVTTIKREGGSRLLKATLQPGEVKNPAGTPEDDRHVVWSGAPTTFYAYCSTTVPRIAWQDGTKYVAEEFDFGGDGVFGAQQNDANIYQALCHGFFNDELPDKAASLGYVGLPDGGRGQFEISSPDQLSSTQ